MILELHEDEAPIERVVLGIWVHVDLHNAVEDAAQLLGELLLGLVLGHSAEEQAAIVHGLDDADRVAPANLLVVQVATGALSHGGALVEDETVAPGRAGEIQHEAKLQDFAHPLGERQDLELVAVARQTAQEHLGSGQTLRLALVVRARGATLPVLLDHRVSRRLHEVQQARLHAAVDFLSLVKTVFSADLRMKMKNQV